MKILTVPQKIQVLRERMAAHGLSAWIVYSADPHLSEYLPEHWSQREYLSGFTGSAGFMAVTQKQAALWTDSRYWVQAEAQLQGSGIELMKLGAKGVPSLEQWICAQLSPAQVVGVNGMALSVAQAQQLEQQFAAAELAMQVDLELLDAFWTARPPLPQAPIYEHEERFAGAPRREKIARVRQTMQELGASWHLISSLDDIAWLLNLRGSDVDYNPVFLSHLLLSEADAYLFVDEQKLSPELKQQLLHDGVVLKPYEAVQAVLAAQLADDACSLLIDPVRTAWAIVQPYMKQVQLRLNPSQGFKAQKTAKEIAHIRHAMEKDGAALCEFFAEFERRLQAGEQLSELDVDSLITAARARQPDFVCPSFATIAGFNANGALPHYRALPESHVMLEGDGLLLIDSGGQYLDGTTDITRVVPIGTITAAHKKDVTLVLKGMVNLSMAVFPVNEPGPNLDAIARLPLWQHGLDFGHGTGHGVGYFLNVHEGPQVISHYGFGRAHTEMKEGMITSNEPGLYRTGQWGVRIENLVLNQSAYKTEFGEFLRFETLTLCPIDTRCIDVALLTETERAWLNSYHAEVRERLSPYVTGEAKDWLLKRTMAI
ncbi:aminopeptidase P family protein [Oligella urethralis]|uniref:aminopeptidase P family protein n=1 Tax=Oligella urethralis TaxID=90245 RepID=UPI00254FDC87|nr:aminopeptidase P family protein [Oligella urethralis]MDK6202686.1 aminopeptidase P family protein [Oligella urethralis]